MMSWIIDVATTMVGALCVIAFLYGVVSRDNREPKRQFSRLDRRTHEMMDRRREDRGPPAHLQERRRGPRRVTEMA